MARRVISLRGTPIRNEEGAATAAITPGQMVDGVTSLAPGPSSGGPGRNYALERDERGQDIDEAYAIGDTVKLGAFSPGMRVYTWLASGQNIAENAFLMAGGSGLLIAHTGTNTQSGRALEAVNNTGGSTGPSGAARIRLEVY